MQGAACRETRGRTKEFVTSEMGLAEQLIMERRQNHEAIERLGPEPRAPGTEHKVVESVDESFACGYVSKISVWKRDTKPERRSIGAHEAPKKRERAAETAESAKKCLPRQKDDQDAAHAAPGSISCANQAQ